MRPHRETSVGPALNELGERSQSRVAQFFLLPLYLISTLLGSYLFRTWFRFGAYSVFTLLLLRFYLVSSWLRLAVCVVSEAHVSHVASAVAVAVFCML